MPDRLIKYTEADTDKGDGANATATATSSVILPVPVVVHKSKVDRVTRMFAWLTSSLLAAAVLISLVFVTRDRDQLRSQIIKTTYGLECRAKAATDVNQAITDEQVALASHSVLVGEFISVIIRTPDANDPIRETKLSELVGKIEAVDDNLARAGVRLQQAVDAQKEALRVCQLG